MTRIPRTVVRAPSTLSRRRLLAALATGSAATIAGCLGGNESGDDPGEQNETADGNETDQSDENDENSPDQSVPEDFSDHIQLREYSREFVDLLAAGETETATQWLSPAVVDALERRPQTPSGVVEEWQNALSLDGSPERYRSVAYAGNNAGNDNFTLWIVDGDRELEVTLTYGDGGISRLIATPIPEWSPPDYVDETAITEEEIELATPLDCSLGGTITRPADADGPVPGVVLVHGNGPQDRDVTTGPNRPFKELAWGLATRGVAVLRYDKRTFACPVDHADATVDDIVTADALTALDRLKSHQATDTERIFVAGQSFGGLFAPRITARDGTLAGTVMLAPGPARSFATTIVDQTEHLLDLQGITGVQREQRLEQVEAEAEQIRSLDIDDDEIVRFGGREFYESLQSYDHTETVAELDTPVLLLQGGQDWQVTVEDDLPIWREALADKANAQIVEYPDLNHLLQVSEGRRTRAEYVEPNSPVAERVIDDIAAFVGDQSGDSRAMHVGGLLGSR